MKHILYGAAISFFSGKARSYLRWKGVDFEERTPDPAFYKEICIPRIGRPVIPVLITPDDETLQDTTEIIDHFELKGNSYPVMTPQGGVQNLVSLLLELFADDWLLIPAMHYRWEYDADDTIAEFGMNLAPGKSKEEQRAVGEERAKPFQGAPPLLGIHPHNKKIVERLWRDLLGDLDAHFRAFPFLLGDRPCAGDFGLVGALYAHMYRDATAGALMRREGLAVARYVERMMHPSGEPLGDYLPDDAIPETLTPVMQRMMREQMPVLAKTAAALATWKAGNPREEIPRFLGQHKFTLEGVEADRVIISYVTWMHGRAKNAYDALADAVKMRADSLLDAWGGELFRKTAIEAPVALVNHQLEWAN
ncbi:MAG: glutathione S-transferase N-terminal domain-containing protein [Pseudomonadota bacterium]